MKFFIKLLVVGCITLITGCLSSPVKMDKYKPVDMVKAPIMPTLEQISGKADKVVVLPADFEDKGTKLYADEVTPILEQGLMKSGIKVVDRKLAKKLAKEIEFNSAIGIYKSTGIPAAQVVVKPTLVSLSYGASFTQASSWTDKKGVRHHSAAKCQHKSTAKIYVRSYRLPSMELISTHEFDGDSEFSSETNNSSCPISNAASGGLIAGAVRDSIDKNSHLLQNDFAPVGYVRGRRDNKDGDESLIQITLGKKSGALKGTTVVFKQKDNVFDDLTNTSKVETYTLGEGKVIEHIQDSSSWVKVDDKEVFSKLRVGDIAEFSFSNCKHGKEVEGPMGICIPIKFQ